MHLRNLEQSQISYTINIMIFIGFKEQNGLSPDILRKFNLLIFREENRIELE